MQVYDKRVKIICFTFNLTSIIYKAAVKVQFIEKKMYFTICFYGDVWQIYFEFTYEFVLTNQHVSLNLIIFYCFKVTSLFSTLGVIQNIFKFFLCNTTVLYYLHNIENSV